MLVLVASTGAAVSIACDAAASVGAVGDALAAHPDVAVPRRDQLLIFDGRRLEGETRTLAEYGLPERAGDFLETTRSLSEPLLSQRNVSPGDAPSSGAPGASGAKEPRSSVDEKNENDDETPPPLVQYVFLYRKSALRSERASSAGETPSEKKKESKESASAVAIEPTPPPPRSDGSHPLERAAVRLFVHREQHESGTESVSSRLHRLVALERSLAHAAARVQARRAASAARLRRAEALVRATRVRALAADAASASAETHLASTLAAHAEFTMRMRERTRRQADLLASFEDDLETLRSTTLETKVLQTPRTTTESAHESQSRTCCSLLDLVDVTSLHEWHNSSRDAHDGFVARMESLETRVADLKRSVERVLATTPDVDVEALEAELDSARDALRAQKDVVDETLADAANARALASRCVAALEKRNLLEYDANEPEPPPLVDATQSGGEKRNELGETNEPRGRFSSVHVVPGELVTAAEVDALSAAEATHVSASFTRVAATDDVLAAFHAHCETCGSAMARDARARLIEIAETQRAIGAARDARAALEEIAIRTEKPFVRLFGACRALPARHAACLAESARRAAYAERLAARARRVADLFAADEKEERDRREAFRSGTGASSANADERLRFLAPALDAVARATLGSATPVPSVEITARGVPRERDPLPDDAPRASSVDEELAAVFAESLS